MKVLNRSIDVVCEVDKEGAIKIDRFRLEENDVNVVVKIKNHGLKEVEKIAGEVIYKYKCTAIVRNELKNCELRFKRDSTEWILFKI